MDVDVSGANDMKAEVLGDVMALIALHMQTSDIVNYRQIRIIFRRG